MHPIQHERIRNDAAALCEIGNRFVGNAGEAEAREFIGRRFREVGLRNVREESFEVATYRPRAARCELVGVASGSTLACVGLQFTAAGEIESEAADLGALRDWSDLDRALARAGGVAGRIAVLKCPYPYLFTERLVAEGAVAIVDISEARDGHICHLNAMMYPALAANPTARDCRSPGSPSSAATPNAWWSTFGCRAEGSAWCTTQATRSSLPRTSWVSSRATARSMRGR